MSFDNKTVIVTGAAGNLGRAVAKAFAELGANLVLVDLERGRLESAFESENDRRSLVPAATPKDIIALLNAEIRKVVDTAEVRERYAAQGVIAGGSTPEEFGAILASEVARWAKVIKAAGIRVE